SDFAAATYKHALVKLILDGLIPKEAVRGGGGGGGGLFFLLLDIAKEARGLTVLSRQPRAIERDIAELRERLRELDLHGLELFLKLSGEYLDLDTYDRQAQRLSRLIQQKPSLKEAIGRAKGVLNEIRKLVKEYLKAAKEGEAKGLLQVEPWPTDVGDTFAILNSDGDDMGSWISGLKLPPLKLSVPLNARDRLSETLKECEFQALLDDRRPLSPAAHVAISRSLLWYAKEVMSRVVEGSLGALVYAGGDDVLALLPAEWALPVAQRLSEEFMREWDNRRGYVALGMGHRASCSVGIVLAHYMHHLSHAVAQAREVVDEAKKELKEGVHGKGAVKAELYGRAGLIARMSKAIHWVEPWGIHNIDALRGFVAPLSEDGVVWVGVSSIAGGRDLINETLIGRAGASFFSPLIMAHELGAISRGGLGRLGRVGISRRAFYELYDRVLALESLEPEPLMAIARLSLRRHAQLKGLEKMLDLVMEVLKVLGSTEKIKSTIEATVIAEHAYEFSLSTLGQFKVALG
ncbi:MAG: type III-B CRISPR-associated protein Cas10/Cmr2, partial [Candidatus Nezhaarchaeota archaeon]|nr:type III-B CRISPR-associated protein Cas10/Cmr2 [Candidatus Nezhaarchaeota archaeon]